MTEIITNIITGALTLIGVCVTAWATGRKTQTKVEVAQAVTNTRLEELTREVQLQNEFVRRIPVLEVRLGAAEQRLQQLDRSHPAC